jgi:hypothetical protein
MKNGQLTYYNEQTYDRVTKKPGEVWSTKLDALAHLTPRDDLDGYEYKEAPPERRTRNRLKTDFEVKLRAEIKRRAEKPTPIEQVEDVLFDIVDATCTQYELEERRVKMKEKKRLKKAATQNFSTETVPSEKLGTKILRAPQENPCGEIIVDLSFESLMNKKVGLLM